MQIKLKHDNGKSFSRCDTESTAPKEVTMFHTLLKGQSYYSYVEKIVTVTDDVKNHIFVYNIIFVSIPRSIYVLTKNWDMGKPVMNNYYTILSSGFLLEHKAAHYLYRSYYYIDLIDTT